MEALVQVYTRDDGTHGTVAYVFLHRTLDAQGELGPVPGALVVVEREDGSREPLLTAGATEACAVTPEADHPGTCYGRTLQGVRPGERLGLTVELPDGHTLTGATKVPGDLRVDVPRTGPACALPPGQNLELTWDVADGAWAYVAEANIHGLARVFAGTDVEVDDPLRLVGLALSATDTTIVFPAEFGIFDRANLDREVAVLLQQGLPAETGAQVAVVAVDRNYVNWVRGGNFNPSGQVRIPSVRGEGGTGFFGSVVRDDFGIVANTPTATGLPACAPLSPPAP